jgi:Concanavalin A-like lectin/glucanases superfamily
MIMKNVNSRMLLAAVIALGFFATVSCKKSSSSKTVTLIGGFASSDSVEPQALISYWPMDGNLNDAKGSANATGVNVTYVTGVRGQAYQGDTSAYASFTPTAAMTALQSFSLSFWFYQPAQPDTSPYTPQGIFFLADQGGANALIIAEEQPYTPVSGDSIVLHAGLDFPAATQWNGWTMSTFDTAAIGKWVFFTMTYNGGTSTYTVYQNAQAMNNQSAYGTATSTELLQGPAGSTPQGNMNFTSDPPVEGTIGTWAPGVYGVDPTLGSNHQSNWQGKLDEIRLFNIALTQTDIAGLYLNGLAGR